MSSLFIVTYKRIVFSHNLKKNNKVDESPVVCGRRIALGLGWHLKSDSFSHTPNPTHILLLILNTIAVIPSDQNMLQEHNSLKRMNIL